MTTSSGKPPLDEQALDSSWDAMGADAPPSEDGPVDTPQFVRPAAANAKKAAERPIYGAGVPYGGDDRTEEIEPIGLDMPFSAEEARSSAALTPRLANTPRPTPAAAKPDPELRAPIAELVLSDLFDSAPAPSGSMAPPDPRVFTTTPPPPATDPAPRGWREMLSSPWSLSRPGADAKFLAGSSNPAKSPKPPSVTPPGRMPSNGPNRSEAAARTTSARSPSAPNAAAAPLVAPAATPAAPEVAVAGANTATTQAGSSAAAGAAASPSPAPGSNPTASPNPAVSPSTVPRPSSSGVVALPSINVLAHGNSKSGSASGSTSGATSDFPGGPGSAGSELGDVRTGSRSERPSSPPAAEALGEPRENLDTGRRSVPTLESVGNAAAARAISLSAESGAARRPGAAGRGDADSTPPLPHFPSEIPTSRPPDVNPSSAPSTSSRPPSYPSHAQPGWTSSASPGREARAPSSNPPQSTVAALPSTRTGKHQLPSVMLGSDVEVEPDTAARRALRAARATVRIELPPNLGRPGSPIGPGAFVGFESAEAPEPPFRAPAFKTRFLEGKKVPLAIAALFVLAACLVLLLRPRYGSLVVTALGPGQRAVDNVQIFVDDAPLCATSPCRISGLSLGTHKLRATAAGLASAEVRSVEVASGEEATANIELTPTAGSEVQAGGLRMPAGAKDYTLFIDDRRVGKLPQSVSGLASGKHWIKLEPEDGSGVIEKGVMIRAGEVADVDPLPAKRDKVLVTIRLSPESEGASVTLDDAFLLDFPAELELDPKSVHVLSATKPGYEDYSQTLQLGEGETEKLVELALVPLDGHHPHVAKPAHKPAAAKAAAPAQSGNGPAIDSAEGLLNISSVPPSQIILNGRPLGSTPKTAIVVPGDSMQTIVFVHPKMGRRRAQKFVPAGKERTVSIRF